MKFTDFINSLIIESEKTVAKLSYGFGHGEFNGRKISVRTLEVNTNSKQGVYMKTFELDGKRIGKAKLFSMFA